ncbi:alpha/beta fold hydrolase [Pseudomonas sp. CGJS7]|uniref:alpha/beta fold hydrolase n=1 Tax=Pseudomonas sp. CGJS7 TaxID=3109348 RepID=UPI003009A562
MNRRTFIHLGLGAVGASLLGGCAVGLTGASAGGGGAAGAGAKGAWDAAAFHAARRFVPTSFGEIAYVERGSGPVALLLHGFPLNGFQWRGVMAELAPHRRCIAPDWLGLGYTRVAEGQSVAPDAQVGMLIAFLDKLGIDQVDVIANDSGGQAAQLLVAAHPERVRSLLLTNCDTEIDSPPPAVLPVIEAARRGRFALDTFPPQLADHEFARSDKGIGVLCFTYPQHPSDEAIETYFRPLVESPQRVRLTDAYAIGLDPNPLAGVAATLKQRDLPVRILWGTGDTIFTPAAPEYLDKLFPNSRGVRKIEGAKLFFPEEFPQEIAAEALKLWSGA